MGWGAFFFGLGIALIGLTCMVYVAWRFLAVIAGLEMQMLREIINQQRGVAVVNPLVAAGHVKPTQGDFVPYNDEEAFINERAAELRREGLAPSDLEEFVRQAVKDEVR